MDNIRLLLVLAAALITIAALAPNVAGQSNSNNNNRNDNNNNGNSNSNNNNNNNNSNNSNTNAICTGPMIRSFGSCLGYLASGSNSSSPTTACCSSLRDLMSNGQDCLCLIVTGGVPFQVPINQDLAISLPKACKQSGVPIECKATVSPVPAPDPENSGPGAPTTSPSLSPPPSSPSPPVSQVPFNPQPLTPPSGGGMTPPQAPEGDVVPTLTPPGMRPTLSAAALPAQTAVPSLLVAVMAVFLL